MEDVNKFNRTVLECFSRADDLTTDADWDVFRVNDLKGKADKEHNILAGIGVRCEVAKIENLPSDPLLKNKVDILEELLNEGKKIDSEANFVRLCQEIGSLADNSRYNSKLTDGDKSRFKLVFFSLANVFVALMEENKNKIKHFNERELRVEDPNAGLNIEKTEILFGDFSKNIKKSYDDAVEGFVKFSLNQKSDKKNTTRSVLLSEQKEQMHRSKVEYLKNPSVYDKNSYGYEVYDNLKPKISEIDKVIPHKWIDSQRPKKSYSGRLSEHKQCDNKASSKKHCSNTPTCF